MHWDLKHFLLGAPGAVILEVVVLGVIIAKQISVVSADQTVVGGEGL
jgi:hypothetical protein